MADKKDDKLIGFQTQWWDRNSKGELPVNSDQYDGHPQMIFNNGKERLAGQYEWVWKPEEYGDYTNETNKKISKIWENDEFVRGIRTINDKKSKIPTHLVINKTARNEGGFQTPGAGAKGSKGSHISTSLNPFKDEIFLLDFFNPDKNNAPHPDNKRATHVIGFSKGASVKEFYRDYLKALRDFGYDEGNMTKEEVKNALRKIARQKAIGKAAVYGGGGLLAGTGATIGGIKLYKHFKNKKSEDDNTKK